MMDNPLGIDQESARTTRTNIYTDPIHDVDSLGANRFHDSRFMLKWKEGSPVQAGLIAESGFVDSCFSPRKRE